MKSQNLAYRIPMIRFPIRSPRLPCTLLAAACTCLLSAHSLAADEEAASGKALHRALVSGAYGKWTAVKRHATEQALLERVAGDYESSEVEDLSLLLKLDAHRGELIPSMERPLVLTDPLQRLRYFLNHGIESAKAAEDPSFVAPAAKHFPGAVDASVPREKELKVRIVPRTGRQGLWEEDEAYLRPHPTGCYAAPGEIVSLVVPQALVGKAQVMIGLHRDDLVMSGDFDESGLKREGFDLTTTKDIEEANTRISSPYGGPVFVCIANKDQAEPPFEITLSGVVKAPRFKSGETSLEEWKTSIRARKVPWAELESDSLLISLPSSRISHLDDPKAVLDFWDAVLAADAELACVPAKRKVIEHVVIDREVSAGYMYCVTDRVVVPDDDSCALMLDVEKLRKEGSWGHFHELGHRHQFADIDFAGTEEVTVNLFTLYVYRKLLNQDHYTCRREDDWSRETVMANIRKYLRKPSFKVWQDDPFLALSFFVPVLDEFGWEPIQKMHAEYRRTPKEKLPTTEAEKRDFFYQHLSRALGRDLWTYFQRWAIPVRKSARIPSSEKLPTWWPDGLDQEAPGKKGSEH